MKITILDSFLHGDLKPWKFEVSNQKHFTNLLAGNTGEPNSPAGLAKQLKSLLADYPTLLAVLENEAKIGQTTLTGHFYETSLPIYNNPAQNYCTQVITLEALRLFNQFLSLSASWVETVDRIYQTKQILTSIRVLASQIATELQQRGMLSIPDIESSFTHYTLFILKQKLVALFFDIQEIFKTELPETENEESFFVHHLNEPFPKERLLKPGRAFFEFKLRQLLEGMEFDKPASTALLAAMQSLQGLQSLQTALENYLIINTFLGESIKYSVEQLIDTVIIKEKLADCKQEVNAVLAKFGMGYQRLELVNEYLEDFEVFQEATTSQTSLAQKFKTWLCQQKELYMSMANDKFPTIATEAEVMATVQTQKLTFGFNGDDTKLKTVVLQLCNQVQLLNEDKTSLEELMAVLVSRDLKNITTEIHIGCETAQLRYIIDKIKPSFLNLKFTALEKSGLFYTRNGILLKAQNLSASKVDDPKTKETIDSIVKHLQ